MLKILLILKYLRRRRIAWVSLVAVTLCTTMVLVVISVMGGWLRTFRASFHGLEGDVIVAVDGHVASTITGFPYYQEMIQQIDKLPEMSNGHAVPVIQTVGLLNLYNGEMIEPVQVLGFYIDQIGEVNDFPKSLYWQYQEPLHLELDRLHEKELPLEQQAKFNADHVPSFAKQPKDFYQGYLRKNANFDSIDGMIVGIGVIDIHKNSEGNFEGREGKEWKYKQAVALTVIRLDEESLNSPATDPRVVHNYVIVDDSRTGIYNQDSRTVYVSFEKLQKDLGFNQTQVGDTVNPDRTSQIWIRAQPGMNLLKLRDKIQMVCDDVVAAHKMAVRVTVKTWEDQEGISVYLHAIENEKLLMTILFGIISVVAIFLIFCIFYMIVQEKTRDIGIIKSVGASNRSVAAIFLGYGLAIGVVGAGMGLLFGYLIIHNINYLHAKIGEIFHVKIWDPQVYAFDTIPSTMNPHEVAVIVAVAIISAVAGSLVPALRAAWMTPVEALRWE